MSILSRLKVPAFRAGGAPPRVDERQYRLEVLGLVEEPASFSLEEIKSWPMTSVDARLTSVSGWSVRALWQGVLWSEFLESISLRSKASHATFSSLGGGYHTTISLEELDHPRVLLAYAVENEPLELQYGGPLRMIVPHLWGYKSAKWLGTIEFTDRMHGGYWEDKGYTRTGIIEPGTTLDLNTGKRRNIQGGEVTQF
jgi:DMSO/TMAO reductase YedYZ molybdopterin-dependent catalytic subunit